MAGRDDPFELVGKVLDGRYRIEAVIGEGGFGVVYRAFHLGFEDRIAVKVLKVPPRANEEQRRTLIEAFRKEGKLLRDLSDKHSSFVRVREMGVVPGVLAPFLVLEWLEGESLEAELDRRRAAGFRGRSLAETMALLAPVADALATAHGQTPRIAHRDVKPANIFLAQTAEGVVPKLLDLGIAKIMTDTGTAALHAPTQGGVAALSPEYAAPEQWHRKYGATGPWTDVYAFALVCVEMLTDRPALEGDDAMQMLAATVDEARPTPAARGARVPGPVEEVFRQALTIEAKDRWRDMGAFWAALVAAAQGRTAGRSGETVVGQTVEGPPGPQGIWMTEPMAPPGPAPAVPVPAARARWSSRPSFVAAAGAVLQGAAIAAALLALVGAGVWVLWLRDRGTDGADGASAPATASPVVPASAASGSPGPCGDEMVLIPGGTFKMGSDSGDKNEKPVHEITVASFCLDRTEVTVGSYAACVRERGCTAPGTGGACNVDRPDRQKHPVNCVDWSQADTYCRTNGKRLPSEREWEYAASGGSEERTYPWGEAPPGPTLLNGCGDECSFAGIVRTFEGQDPWPTTAEVGSCPEGRARWGNDDMAGNVDEWTASWDCPYPNDGSKKCTSENRVIRGGSWTYAEPFWVRAAARDKNAPSAGFDHLGFRCARTAS